MPRGLASTRLYRLGGINGRRRAVSSDASFTGYLVNYGPGDFTWNAPAAGTYRFVAWGCGGFNNPTTGGGGGSLVIKDRICASGESVTLHVADGSVGADPATTATFSDTSTFSAGSASGQTAGTATGGDTNVNGASGGADDGGAAGSSGTFTGGAGSVLFTSSVRTPGGGASRAGGTVGNGMLFILRLS